MEIWTNNHNAIIDLDAFGLDALKTQTVDRGARMNRSRLPIVEQSNRCRQRESTNIAYTSDDLSVEQVIVKPELVILDDDEDNAEEFHQNNFINFEYQQIMGDVTGHTSSDEDDGDFISYEELKLQHELEALQGFANGNNDNGDDDDDDGDDVIVIETDEEEVDDENDGYEYVDPNKPHICRVCLKQVANRYNLKRHMMIHTGEKPYGCDICQKRFREFSDLRKHRRVHNRDQGYVCMVCFEEAPSADDSTKCQSCLDKEVAQKPSSSISTIEIPRQDGTKKAYVCPICGRVFGSPHNLKRHIMIHTGEKPFKCDTCNRPFRELSTLRKHQLTHAQYVINYNRNCGESDGSLYECSICRKKFLNSSNLTEHIQAAHSELRVNCNSIEYHPCPECNRHFRTKHHLQSHIVTHLTDNQ